MSTTEVPASPMRPLPRGNVLRTPTLLLLSLALGACLADRAPEPAGFVDAGFWEPQIEAYEAADAEAPPAPGAILFTGSSSIRLWETLERDMAPLRVLNRGFGGAHLDHVRHFADRIVTPYAPRAIVLYAGDNDIAAGKSPETVEADFRALVERIRSAQPEVPIYFLTIKPSPQRWSFWPAMRQANERIAAIAALDPTIHVIDVSTPLLRGRTGGPPPARLFVADGLHLSETGYALWTEAVRGRLLEDLGEDAGPGQEAGGGG